MTRRRPFLSVLLLLSVFLLAPSLRADPQLPPLSPTPFMGWNTWYTFGAVYDEAALVSVVDRIVSSGLKDAGYNIVWLDSGWWQGARDGGGNIVVSATQWPHGMAWLAQYIHNAGLKAGIYTDAGHGGCAGFGQGSFGHYQQDMNTFAAWGYDAVKVDWCGASSDLLDPKPTFAAIRDAVLNNSSGRPMLLDLCSWHLDNDSWEFGPYTGHAWRTHGDIAFIGTDATWYAMMGNFDSNSAHPGSSGPNHWNDPDYLLANVPGVRDLDAQSQFSLWAMSAAPLIIGGDVRTLSPAQLAMLTNPEVIAINQDPLGVQAVRAADPAYQMQIWSKVLATSGSRAVALFNRSDAPTTITLVNSELGLSGSFNVRDVWAHADRGRYSSYAATVGPHEVVLLRLTGGIENNVSAIAVNAGGQATGSFIADTNTVDGLALTSASPIALGAAPAPAPAAVYQTARAGKDGLPLQYYIGNLAVGASYRVRLHFAENWLNGAGLRRFTVRINGSLALNDFDVYAAAGNQLNTAVVQEFTTTATQGFVSIDLSKGSAGDPMISGVEVIATNYVAPAASPTNLARGASAFVSSQWDANYSAAKANDGNTNATRWNAGGGTNNGEWLEIDLGTPTTFDKTVIREAFNRIAYYTTQYFSGGVWVDITAGRKAGAAKADTFPPITASRVRLFVNTAVPDGGGDSPTIWEFEIYNTGASTPGGGTTVPPNTIPAGAIEEVRVSDAVARGWTYDPDSASSSVNVQAYVDGPAGIGTSIGAAAATSVARADINAAFGITGTHGFELTLPATYRDGLNHTLYVYATDVNTAGVTALLAGSPKAFNIPAPAPATPGNLALGATATASSQWDANYSAAKAIDGNSTTTRWNAAGATGGGEWLQIDFGASRTFDSVRLVEALDRITAFKIQFDSGGSWVDAATGTTIGSNKTVTFAPASSGKVRLLVVSTAATVGGASASIFEFEVYNSAAGGSSTPPPSGTTPENLAALPATVATASSQWNSDYGAKKAADQNTATRWNAASGKSANEWLELNFGTPKTFDRTTIREAFGRVTAFKIQYGDGGSWTDAVVGNTIGTSRTDIFAPVTASRVRLFIVSAAVTGGDSSPTIVEFEVLGTSPASPGGGSSTPSSPASAAPVGIDSTSQGNWKTLYAAYSPLIALDTLGTHSSGTVRVSNHLEWTWGSNAADPRVLVRDGGAPRLATTWWSTSQFTVQTTFTDGRLHRVALYLMDFDFASRIERIDAVDAQTGAVLGSQTINNFSGGVYALWDVRGDVIFKLSPLAGNAVLSGVFVEPSGSP